MDASSGELVKGRTLSYLDLAVSEKHFDGAARHSAGEYEVLGSSQVDDRGRSDVPLLGSRARSWLRGGWGTIAPMVLLQATVIALFLVKEVSICGSPLFWTLTVLFLPITLLFGVYSRWYLNM